MVWKTCTNEEAFSALDQFLKGFCNPKSFLRCVPVCLKNTHPKVCPPLLSYLIQLCYLQQTGSCEVQPSAMQQSILSVFEHSRDYSGH